MVPPSLFYPPRSVQAFFKSTMTLAETLFRELGRPFRCRRTM